MSRCCHVGAALRAAVLWLGGSTLTGAQTREYLAAVCAVLVTSGGASVGIWDVC